MRRFKLVTFDVTNTLLKFRASVGEEYAQMAQSHGVHVKKESLTKSFKTQWKLLNALHPNFGLTTGLSSEQWWSEMVKGTFRGAGYQDIHPEKLEAISSHLYQKYNTKDCWELYPGVIETLEFLRSNGVNIGVISNFDERLLQILGDIGIYHYFGFILCSYLAKHVKPSPEIFQIALQKAKVGAKEAVHIGDNVELDYLGAKNAGWNALIVVRDQIDEKHADKVNKHDILSHITDIKRFF